MGLAKRRDPGIFDDPRQMLLPLLIDLDFNEEVLQNADPALVEGVRQDQPQLDEWTDDELVQLHQVLLEQSMIQALNPRSSKATRLEVLDWVDQVTPYKEKAKALSFDACCQFSGYDPEELREQLHGEMKFRGIHPNPNRSI
jgi:hypothetical protein